MSLVLSTDHIERTLERLQRRISERFPGSGLLSVCGELLEVARHARERSTWIARPNLGLRVLTASIITFIVVGSAVVLMTLKVPKQGVNVVEFIQLAEAGINDLVLIGAAIFFFSGFETRLKRGRALDAIHELRAIAHIIDMHQLAKDPDRILGRSAPTESSPRVAMTHEQMLRYLDYCSEMLALNGKIAALYVQNFTDPVVLTAANEIEGLSTGLSQKIWQKLDILQQSTAMKDC